jgi:hypothetical protein
VFEDSGHMTFLEDNAGYLTAVGDFLGSHGLV